MEFSTPTYTMLQEKKEAELRKMKNGDVDVFVKIVNQARREPAEVEYPVSIGWKPEAVERIKQAEKNKISQTTDYSFLGGMLFAVLVLGMIALLLVM